MDLTAQQTEFHLAEFVALKKEARDALATAAAHFRWAVAVSAALLAWFWTEGQDFEIATPAFFAPATITALLGGVSAALTIRARQISGYLLTLESTLGRKPGLGWEEAFAPRRRVLTALHALLWALLFFANVYAGLALQADAGGDQQYETRQASAV